MHGFLEFVEDQICVEHASTRRYFLNSDPRSLAAENGSRKNQECNFIIEFGGIWTSRMQIQWSMVFIRACRSVLGAQVDILLSWLDPKERSSHCYGAFPPPSADNSCLPLPAAEQSAERGPLTLSVESLPGFEKSLELRPKQEWTLPRSPHVDLKTGDQLQELIRR
jgi:hypothetical protein